MTPEQIELVREARALLGAPDVPFTPCPTRIINRPDYGIEILWDIADTSPLGFALGGVLLGALGGELAYRIEIDHDPTNRYTRFLVEDVNCELLVLSTLSEACCVVALVNGCWPGGMNNA